MKRLFAVILSCAAVLLSLPTNTDVNAGSLISMRFDFGGLGTADGYTGRSAFEAPDADGLIRLTARQPLTEGTFVRARLTGAGTYDLTGEVI